MPCLEDTAVHKRPGGGKSRSSADGIKMPGADECRVEGSMVRGLEKSAWVIFYIEWPQKTL